MHPKAKGARVAMIREYALTQNLASWDRVLRLIVGAALILGTPLVTRAPWWLTIVGALGGSQLIAAITGY